MELEQVIEHFGGSRKTCERLGVSKAAISSWRKKGRIPLLRQKQIEQESRGRFKAGDIVKQYIESFRA